MGTHSIPLDSPTIGRSTSLIPAVQTAYDASGYPSLTITQAFVLTNGTHVGLSWWIPLSLLGGPYPLGSPANYPTAARLTPAEAGTPTSVFVNPEDEALASAIAAAVGGGVTQNQVLSCACCTGLAMISGLAQQVGPFHP
jgi:hypothetical protein